MFLATNWAERDDPSAIEIPTGVWVESLDFIGTNDVQVSGYVWQRFPGDLRGSVDEGFVLPDQIDFTARSQPVIERYRVLQADTEVVGSYFEATVRQPFDFSDFPFDRKTFWLRLWPTNFNRNIVLVPDLGAYPCPTDPSLTCTGVNDRFGLNQQIVLSGFRLEKTYYDYQLSDYDTNFGLDDFAGQTGFPELRYNVLLERQPVNAVGSGFIPLFLVAALAFAVLLTTRTKSESDRVGFSVAGALGTLAALVFVLVVPQTQLRQQFAGSGLVYIEWLYLVMYLAVFGVAVTVYMSGTDWASQWRVTRYGDSLVAKVLYWPLLLAALVIVTAVVL